MNTLTPRLDQSVAEAQENMDLLTESLNGL